MSQTLHSDNARFRFGENWISFINQVDSERMREARASLSTRLGELSDRSFLDAGCGSGLFSLAAIQLGSASVRSLDYDEESVRATASLKERFAGSAAHWRIEKGDILDERYVDGLGEWDVVYSWGVLHHTGDMRRAWENISRVVAPQGRLYISIYNDQGPSSRLWAIVKRGYHRLPRWLTPLYVTLIMAPRELAQAFLLGPTRYGRKWRDYQHQRGMSRWHDMVDWVGGYPFEVAKPEEVFDFFRSRGFELEWMSTCAGRSGCNQFVFNRQRPI